MCVGGKRLEVSKTSVPWNGCDVPKIDHTTDAFFSCSKHPWDGDVRAKPRTWVGARCFARKAMHVSSTPDPPADATGRHLARGQARMNSWDVPHSQDSRAGVGD